MMSCTDFFGDRQFTRLVLGEQHGQVATALADLPHVDRRAGLHAVGESELECRHPFERRTVFVDADLGIVVVQQRIAEPDDGRQHVVQPVCGREREARRIVFGDPTHVGAGQTVGLLFGHQRRGVVVGHPGLVLNGVPVLVREHHRHAHVAVGLLQRGQELTAVPSDGVVVKAVARVHDSVRGVAAELGVVEAVCVPGDQLLHGFETRRRRNRRSAASQNSSMSLIAWRPSSSISPSSVPRTSRGGIRGNGSKTAGPVGGGHTRDAEGVVEHRDGVALQRRAARRDEQRRGHRDHGAHQVSWGHGRRLSGVCRRPGRPARGVSRQDSESNQPARKRSSACRTRTVSVVAQNGGSDARRNPL